MTKLYRSRTNTTIAGVCGGLGEYFGTDPTLVRLAFILLTLFTGVGLLLYLILLIVMPLDPRNAAEPKEDPGPSVAVNEADCKAPVRRSEDNASRNALLGGFALIAIGVIYLLRNLNLFWLRWLNWGTLWPLLLVAFGLAILVRPKRGE